LFLPLNEDPFNWFIDGAKLFELRKNHRQWTEKHIYRGRRVEIRLGYSGPRAYSAWGTIGDVRLADCISELFRWKISWRDVLPYCSSEAEATDMAVNMLDLPGWYVDEPLICFQIILDENYIGMSESNLKDILKKSEREG